jgi:hypothetical protein
MPGWTSLLSTFGSGVFLLWQEESNEMLIITRCAVIDRIEGVLDADRPGAYRLVFRDNSVVFVRSQDIRRFIASFKCKNGQSIQERIGGLKIVYCMSQEQQLKGFTPHEDWWGPEMNEGDFLVDDDARFGGPG